MPTGGTAGLSTPADYAERARAAVARGYRALKFDPFGTAWKVLDPRGGRGRRGRGRGGPRGRRARTSGLMIEFHGRLGAGTASAMIRRLERFRPAWCEEPVAPGVPRAAGRGQALGRLSDRRRRAALYPGRFLPADGAARR